MPQKFHNEKVASSERKRKREDVTQHRKHCHTIDTKCIKMNLNRFCNSPALKLELGETALWVTRISFEASHSSLGDAVKVCALSDASLGVVLPAYYDSKLWLGRVRVVYNG